MLAGASDHAFTGDWAGDKGKEHPQIFIMAGWPALGLLRRDEDKKWIPQIMPAVSDQRNAFVSATKCKSPPLKN